jgi:hypothetical protein
VYLQKDKKEETHTGILEAHDLSRGHPNKRDKQWETASIIILQ